MIRAFNNASSRTIVKRIVQSSTKGGTCSSSSSSSSSSLSSSSSSSQLKFRSFVSLRPHGQVGASTSRAAGVQVGDHAGGTNSALMNMSTSTSASSSASASANTHHQSLNSIIVPQMNMKMGSSALITTTLSQSMNLNNTSKRNFWSRSKAKNTNDGDTIAPSSVSSSPSAGSEASEKFSTSDDSISTTATATATDDTSTTEISFSPEDEMAKFEQSASTDIQTIDAAAATTTATSTPWESTWWPHDQMVDLINYTHDITGLNYAITIASMTIAFRTIMVPLFIKAQRNSSRMAHVKPEMDVLKAKVDALDPKDIKGQQRYAKEMQALFQKYDVNPLRALALPLIQMPAFMSMFFALRKMPDIFPEKLVDGGILWFVDLNSPDPYYVLPVLSGATFLVMMELGKKQMLASSPEHGQMMLNFFRGMSLLIVPISTSFPTAVLCYWTANNTFSLAQSVAFQNDAVKKMCGIWEMPKPVPGADKDQKGIMDMFQDSLEKQRKAQADSLKERMEVHNAAIEKKKKDRRRSKK